MKLLYLSSDPVPSSKGAGVRLAATAHALRDLGHEVELFTAADADGARLEGFAHETVSLAARNHLERMLAFRAAAAEWLDGRKADVIQFRGIWEGASAVEWSRSRGAAAIFEANGFPSIELPYHFPLLERGGAMVEKLIAEERAVLAAAALVVTPSRTGLRHLLSRGVEVQRIAVVPNAVDGAVFSPAPAPPAEAPPFRLVYEGTLAPWQGLETLLEALVPFRSDGRVELHVVGPSKSRWRDHVRIVARRLRVHHLVRLSGAVPQPELVPLLGSAHACVAPMPADTRNAGQGCCPIKVLEYMATARPILATRIAPLEELLTHGADAWLVRPGSPAALTDGIQWMLANPEKREVLGARARERALVAFSPERFREWTAEALERVTTRR